MPTFEADKVDRIENAWKRLITRHGQILGTRSEDGHLRQLHGDLHLRNIVIWQGAPTLFDAIEFDPSIAAIDTLYDIAFLLMDLLHRDQKPAANAILNRYLQRSGDYAGLPLLPLYLSNRAVIRAHTGASAARNAEQQAEAAAYLDLALSVLEPQPPRAIAIGGASGSGKSTVAAMVAGRLGSATGGIILRSDVVRKRLHGMAPEERLPASGYTAESSKRVFATLADEACAVVDARETVIVDAVFGRPSDLAPLHQTLADRNVQLVGLWLDAPAETLKARVQARHDDASDADVKVLEGQLPTLQQPKGWVRVDASGTPDETLVNLLDALPA